MIYIDLLYLVIKRCVSKNNGQWKNWTSGAVQFTGARWLQPAGIDLPILDVNPG